VIRTVLAAVTDLVRDLVRPHTCGICGEKTQRWEVLAAHARQEHEGNIR
jgi:hypothetical protein